MKLVLTKPIMHPDPLHKYPAARAYKNLLEAWSFQKGVNLGRFTMEWNHVWDFWDLTLCSTQFNPVSYNRLDKFFESLDIAKMSKHHTFSNDPAVLDCIRIWLYPKEEHGEA